MDEKYTRSGAGGVSATVSAMRILFIDVASHHGALACVTEEKTVAIRQVGHRISDTELPLELDAVLQAAGWTERDVTHVACTTGPGGFTSLRVGMSFANALAHALKIPSAGIHLSDLYRARAGTDNMLWLHSTKTKEMFIRGFGIFAKTWPDPVQANTDDLAMQLPEHFSCVGDIIETHRALTDAKKAKILPLTELREMLPAFLQTLPYEHALIQPWYGREG